MSKILTVTMNLEVEDGAIDELKKIEHHADCLLNLDEYPEILNVSNVKVKEE